MTTIAIDYHHCHTCHTEYHDFAVSDCNDQWFMESLIIMFTLQGTTIFPIPKVLLKMIFLFPSWDMLVPYNGYRFPCFMMFRCCNVMSYDFVDSTSWARLRSAYVQQISLWRKHLTQIVEFTFRCLKNWWLSLFCLEPEKNHNMIEAAKRQKWVRKTKTKIQP